MCVTRLSRNSKQDLLIRKETYKRDHSRFTYLKRDLQVRPLQIYIYEKRPTKETTRDLHVWKETTQDLHVSAHRDMLILSGLFCRSLFIYVDLEWSLLWRPTKETYKRDLQKRPTKETYKRNLQKRPLKMMYPLTEEIRPKILGSRDLSCCTIDLLIDRASVYTREYCMKIWGLPWKRVGCVWGLPWKLVGNFGSRSYFKSDLFCPWEKRSTQETTQDLHAYKETYKRDHALACEYAGACKRRFHAWRQSPKETYKRDLQRRPTKETYKRDHSHVCEPTGACNCRRRAGRQSQKGLSVPPPRVLQCVAVFFGVLQCIAVEGLTVYCWHGLLLVTLYILPILRIYISIYMFERKDGNDCT